jgi:hypothetical protein
MILTRYRCIKVVSVVRFKYESMTESDEKSQCQKIKKALASQPTLFSGDHLLVYSVHPVLQSKLQPV